MERLKVPTIEEYPETVFQALERLANFPKDTVTVTDLHNTILGNYIFPGGRPRNLGQRWVRNDFQEGGKYYKYRGEKGDPAALLYLEGNHQYQIKKPLAAMIVADVIRLAMEDSKSS